MEKSDYCIFCPQFTVLFPDSPPPSRRDAVKTLGLSYAHVKPHVADDRHVNHSLGYARARESFKATCKMLSSLTVSCFSLPTVRAAKTDIRTNNSTKELTQILFPFTLCGLADDPSPTTCKMLQSRCPYLNAVNAYRRTLTIVPTIRGDSFVDSIRS